MKDVFIIHAKRTPIGKLGGSLSHFRVDDMLATLFRDFKDSFSFDMKEIDDVITGCANQAGEDNRNLSRMATILAGLPLEVPGVTVNRLCASSLDAIIDGYSRIASGIADCILVGGAESMTRAPYVMSKGSSAFGRDSQMYDTTFGWRFPNPKMKEMFPLLGMGETAEEVAQKLNITREEQDLFAYNSHMKASKAWEDGKFANEVVSLELQLKKELLKVSEDECPRANTTLEQMAKLPAVFRKGGSVTPGNSSPMNDGASCVAIVSEDFLRKHNLKPLARITGGAVRGIHPSIMGLGPVESTKVLLKKFNKKISDFDVFEFNEAFAVQALGCMRELEVDPEKVNLKGGAIALGHPLGCSGARITTTLTHILQENKNFKQALATMCVGVGQGVSLSLENC
ncbi:thiolase family protein [Bacteriovorax sp. Seq25_V]|uniref:thiolase family protein n=1 Tax=Bacteriovorax sp. Seq25_V TaxID=1201288 RepID=UPI00038A42E2|nr:thiolase family protein [Bacteriovorax sp. Seq25_V]EQC43814.1 3-oxoadipyl-CoA thiolase [Bacteriovorax sp. Seq25_V]